MQVKAMSRSRVRLEKKCLAYCSLGHKLGHENEAEEAVDGSPDHKLDEKLLTCLRNDAADPAIRQLSTREQVQSN